MIETRKINYYQKTKEEWFKEMPKLIITLVYGYKFYYGCTGNALSNKWQNLGKYLYKNGAKHKHKICIYFHKNQTYIVVYKKNDIDVFYCLDNLYLKQTYGAFKRTIKRISLAYEEAVKLCRKETEYKSEDTK